MRNSPISLSSSLSSVVTSSAADEDEAEEQPDMRTSAAADAMVAASSAATLAGPLTLEQAEGTRLGHVSGNGIVVFSVNDRQLSGTTWRRSSQTDSILVRGGLTAPVIFTAGM
jgi:hypothetical protein